MNRLRANRAMSTRHLILLFGTLEIVVGIVALLHPESIVHWLFGGTKVAIAKIAIRSFQGSSDVIILAVIRLFGAAILSLGLVCLKSRDDLQSPAGKAVVFGFTCYNILAAVVIIWVGLASGLEQALWWLAGLGHAVLGVLFIKAILHAPNQS